MINVDDCTIILYHLVFNSTSTEWWVLYVLLLNKNKSSIGFTLEN